NVSLLVHVFFFFQAEDGIRDRNVTGVQTCALPIFVGQIAKIKGCRVVGIAGADDKCDYVVDELGFDACVNYKDDDFAAQLEAACPDGIEVYFENVGGKVLSAVVELLNEFSRMPVCGMIAHYNEYELLAC